MGEVIYMLRDTRYFDDPPGEAPECRRAQYLHANTETALNMALNGDYYRAMGIYHCLAEACKMWAKEEGEGVEQVPVDVMVLEKVGRLVTRAQELLETSRLARVALAVVGVGFWCAVWFLWGLNY